jgi:hypothetical protein
MSKQELFELFLKYPNAQDFHREMHSMVWDWHKNGEVKTKEEVD